MSTHRLNEVAAMLRGRKDHMDTDAASDVQAAATQIANLERTLATKELAETKLREALFELRSRCGTIYRSREANMLACDVVSAINDAIMIISTPITTEALDRYVEGKVKEARPVIDGLIWAVAHEDNLSVGMLFDTPAQANAFVASVSASTPPLPTQQYCDDCDGCGWVEGGKAIQTTCHKCKGTGVLPIAQPTEQPK